METCAPTEHTFNPLQISTEVTGNVQTHTYNIYCVKCGHTKTL